jgi:hypothetical protein
MAAKIRPFLSTKQAAALDARAEREWEHIRALPAVEQQFIAAGMAVVALEGVDRMIEVCETIVAVFRPEGGA